MIQTGRETAEDFLRSLPGIMATTKRQLLNTQNRHLPTDAAERKKIPLYSGLLMYFPDALVEVARLSYIGNKQHNPGEKLHWAREKSTDQEDTIMRHLLESGTVDTDGVRHSAKVAWRALALLQLELEKAKESDANKEGTDKTNTPALR